MSRLALRALRILACVLSITCATGCGNACLDLASQICACLPDDGTRAACNQRAKDSQDSFPISSQDAAFCQQKLDSQACDCHQLQTVQGKLSCGVAFP
jgi:hypothetical protein